MTDFRKKSLINMSGCHLGTTFLEDDWDKDVIGMQDLESFLNVENVLNVYAIIDEIENNKRLKFFKEVTKDNYERIVIFTKNKPCVLSDDNIYAAMQISSLSGSPTLALYHTLNNVFTPLLQQEKEHHLQKQVAILQADLRAAIFVKGLEINQNLNDVTTLTIVRTLEQEVQYWDILTNTAPKKDRLLRTSSASFRDILKPLAREYNVIGALPMNDLEDMLERTHNILDDLWRYEPPFPKDRMKNLMDIVAEDVSKWMTKQLQQADIWTEDYNTTADILLQNIEVGSKWLTTCKQLTEIFWPNYTVNPWKEDIYQPTALTSVLAVFQQVLNIRSMHRQLVRLLTPEEQENLDTKDMFSPFKEINVFSEDSNKLLIAQKQFEYLLQPAEKTVAAKLKKQLSTVNANTRQLLYEFSRYSELITRPILKQGLQSERQYLLNNLYDYIRQIQSQATLENYSATDKYNTPQVVKEIIVNRQLESKANEVVKVAEKLLDDLPGYENIRQIVLELLKELKQQDHELFEAWSSEMVSYINDKTLSLKESDPVVQFSKQKLMRVNYSPRLVMLISEVRQLKAMGYHVPSTIEETSNHAKKFMKYARILEQIANFHNTIGDRMIPAQKPMMLASALELSKLVQEQEVVSWGEEKSVEKYVNTLKSAVEKLSKENNLLTSYHQQIYEKIKELENVDLIKEYSRWKDTTKYIRGIMTQIEDKRFKNMHVWKVDIDKKLCHVLEKQYLKSLDTLHLYLPEIHTDLVYRNAGLEFSPNEAALKKQYELQLKKFLDIPKNFRGVSDSPEGNIFSEILEKNLQALEGVAKHKDDLFLQLQSVIKHWQSWLQLETLDTNKLTTWQNWDLHFRASKTFGQEIAKLPSTEERVGCFLIGLSRLRSDLESHNRSYWDQLVNSLKDSIAQDVVKLQNFVDPSTASLTKQPVTIEEVGECGVAHAAILKDLPEMEKCLDEMLNKSKILASWSREQVDAVNRVKSAWDRLQSLLDNHQHIIAKQMETIKTTLNVEQENLGKEIERYMAKLEQIKPKPHSGQISNTSLEDLFKQMTDIKNKKSEWVEIIVKRDNLLASYNKFNIEPPEFPLIEEVENDLKKEQNSWNVFEEFYSELEQLTSEYWIVIRKKLYVFDDFLKKWQAQLNSGSSSDLVTRVQQELHKYKEIAPILKYVRGEDFSEKHWLNTFNLLGMDSKPVDQLTLKDFLNVCDNLESCSKELQVICKKAASEIVVRQALSELDQWEVQSRFVLIPHKDSNSKTLMLVKDYKEILNKVGDNQSLLQSVKNSADYESFSEKANLWENKLGDLDHYLTSLTQIQRKWIYLEPIFGSGTLAQEKSRFDRIDRDFRHILNFIEKDPRVVLLCRYPNLRSLLEGILDQLHRCQNSLDNFLLEKRNKFPRFLFLSDDDLLEVVGQSSKEQVIQTHFKKLFAGINSIELDDAGVNILTICSLHGEVVTLSNPVNIKKTIEEWLIGLVKEMQTTLKDLLVNCQNEKQAPDPLKYPSQILCLSESINFTIKCEQAISSMTLPPLLAKYKSQLSYYSSLELNSDNNKNFASLGYGEGDSDNVLELKLKSLILDTIHHISVLEELLDTNTTKVADWTWQKQLRYYANSMGEVTVKMAHARMEYSYEYLGNVQKLVRTPLTERCFLTLTQGMHLGMGGNPYGPAGTGKTESVKALGGLLGRQVLVFNCDEGLDAASMGRILSGLVRSGAWGCFDEFNRLDEATLSAVSMLIHPIQVALRTNQNTVVLQEQEIQVNKHCGIFVTLNPAGGGYGGRNKLPDNLKQLFRPVVMTHPDHEQIAKSLLHCDGYHNADLIAKKLIEVFDSASKLLSRQQHYDWGLRAIRTTLTGCGRAIKKHKIETNNTNLSMELELNIVVKVLRMDTLSKLTFADSVKFDSIVQNVFRNVVLEQTESDVFTKAIKESCEELGLVYNERQLNKCLELYEQLKQRMGVAIVGPPNCGKSTIRNLLCKSFSKLKRIVKQYTLNPKSMSRSQLLGQIDLDTKQWNDGVLTNYSLQVTSVESDVWSWIVCDGDIDPEWVESLNSVLDDNRLLTLPSGWRIQFGPNVNFIFETHDLSHASPATISRMGIVFLSQEDLNLKEYIGNFVSKMTEVVKVVLEPLVNEYFIKALDWIENDGEITIPCSKLSMANTGLSQLVDVQSKAQFVVGVLNGLGQLLQYDFREFFSQQFYEWTGDVPPPVLLQSKYNKDRDIIESYYTNPNTTIEDISNGLPLVLTGQVMQTLDILKVWLRENNEQNFLLVGPHGSAKTLILKYLISEKSYMEMITIPCSANLSPNFIINKLKQHCLAINTHRGKVYKPKKGHMVLHLKNLHLLKKDKWGTNALIEFLSQIIVYKGFYDTNIEFVGLHNVTIVGSLHSTNNLSSRFTSIVHYFNINLPEREDLVVILLAYFTAVLKETFPNSSWPKAKTGKLVSAMISIYDKIQNNFTQLHQKHYNFSPHDLTDWCSNILRYKNCTFDDYPLEMISYEALKLFGDKLVDTKSCSILYDIINEAIQTNCGKSNILHTTSNIYFVPSPQISSSNVSLTLMRLQKDEWKSMVELGVLQYEREDVNLNVIVTEELLHLTSSVSKVLSSPTGHMLMIGTSGIGRRSAIKIVSALQSAKLIIPSSGTKNQFNNDLKMALQYAGLEGEQVYLQLDDHIFNNANNLNVVNFLIASGEIPGLYNTVELDSLVKVLKDESDRENFEGDLVQYFAERIKRKLHVIVCLDVDNEHLWSILQMCPVLLQNCTILWQASWSEKTIAEMPKMLIEKSNTNGNLDVKCCDGFHKIYDVVNNSLAAPSRYVAMIRLYQKLYTEKLETITLKQNQLNAGVSKLTDASNLVEELKGKAAIQQEKLAEKQSKANAALDMISSTMKNANVHKEEMESLKQKTEEENQQLKKRKKEIELELSEVEPLIQEARSAVGNIKSDSLSEIRSLRAPPDVIRDILEGVLRLMGIQDTSWNSMKTFLAKRGVKEEIRSFDASRITSENRQAVERLMTVKSDSFDPKSAKRASIAAAPLAAWVIANVKYSYVMDKIRPLEKEQNKLKKNLTNSQSQLGELSAGLSDVDLTVAKLKEQLSAYTKEAAEIEIDLNKAQNTLATAEGLVSKLNDEYQRWQEQLKDFSTQIQQLPDFCLLAAAVMTYLSNEFEDNRRQIMQKWFSELSVPEFDFQQFMSSEREQMQWQSEGLSSDKLSVQNAIIILKAQMVPLLVDPTSGATNWVKNHLKNRNKMIESTTFDSTKFTTVLELSVRFGKVCIIEEVEVVNPIILPILRGEFLFQGERKLININGKLMDYHNDFKLILCSRNEQLKFPAYAAPLINILNFTVTTAGLTEQLLSGAVRQENPQLEDKRKSLLREQEELQEKLYRFQNQLLEELASSSGDILQNHQLMRSLNETKASSQAISEALLESGNLQRKLQIEYDVFRDISVFGSALYFACNEFSKCNVLYVLSVQASTKIFLWSLQTFQNLDNKTDVQKRHLFTTVYQFVSRGIFKHDRLKFALHLVHKMFPIEVPLPEWNLFIGVINSSKGGQEDVPAWIPKLSVIGIQNLQLVLPELFKALQLQEMSLWNNFMNYPNCETEFPAHCQLTHFQKLLIVQLLRPDRFCSAATQTVQQIAGLKSLDPSILDLHHILKESNIEEPILLLTVSGTDPSADIRDLAQNILGAGQYLEVAMGEGQEEKALAALRQCAQSGQWLILKNLHLVTSWLTILSQHLKTIEANQNFRLWLISEPSPTFNTVLAQNSLKIVYETPQGLRNNLQRNFSVFGSRYFEKLNANAARIFFVISCVHALVQERRKYIPQGWSKIYEFSSTDFTTCIKLVEDLWQSHTSQIPWKYISGLCTEAVYAGRIENIGDLNILYSYAREYLCDEVLSHRWKPFGLNLNLPSSSQFQDYVNTINQLPNKDEPGLFGLAPNIDKAWEKQISTEITSDLKNIYLVKVVPTKFNRELFHKGLVPLMTLWKKLNQGNDFIRMTPGNNALKGLSSMEIFMLEEFNRAINLVQTIHKSFATLNKICKGLVMPEDKDLNVGNTLINFQTPSMWNDVWKGPREPNQYLRTVINKILHLSKWQINISEILHRPINLSYLFYPEAFLASHKQDFARLNNISADEIILETSWKSSVQTNNSIILTELLIEGALFDGTNLKDCLPNSDNINTVPNCYLNWKDKKTSLTDDNNYIGVPLYNNSNREQQTTSLRIFTNEKDKEKWTKAGLAFYLDY